MLPSTRKEFKEYILRRLGYPVAEINVTDEQIEDRIDDALSWWRDYHYDGSLQQYYKVEITEQMKTDKYITLPENIIGVVRIFDLSTVLGSKNMFDIRYQIALNDMYSLLNFSLVPFYMTFQHIELIQQLLVGKQLIRYNRHQGKLYLDMDWDRVTAGEYIIVECYGIIDPDDYPKAWSDRWLLKYATALVKRQFGEGIKKFTGIPLPGNMTMNGQQIYNEAVTEIEQIEKDTIRSYSIPVADMIG